MKMEKMPVFVKVEEYDSVLNLIRTIRKKLDETKETITKINDLKNEEDHQLEIDHSLNEPEQF